jgi:hypothetical protein
LLAPGLDFEKLAGVPFKATPARRQSSPPEGFLGLTDDVAPGKSDIVQVAVRPATQFATLAPAVTPDVKPFAKSGQKPVLMMFYHLVSAAGGHGHLPKVTFRARMAAYRDIDQRHFVPLQMI